MNVRSRAKHVFATFATAVATLALPGVAQAVGPTVTSVGQSARHVTATWALPEGMKSLFVAVATTPQTYPEGDFIENPVLSESLAPNALTYVSSRQLPAGTYYLHVGASASELCNPGVICDAVYYSTPPSPVTIPPDPPPPPAPPPGPPPPPDTVTALSGLSAPFRQDIDRLYVLVRLGENGTVTVTGTVGVPKTSKVYRFKTASGRATPGVNVKLKPKLAKKALRAVKAALRRHRKVRATLTITARDGAGNVTALKRAVSLTP